MSVLSLFKKNFENLKQKKLVPHINSLILDASLKSTSTIVWDINVFLLLDCLVVVWKLDLFLESNH